MDNVTNNVTIKRPLGLAPVAFVQFLLITAVSFFAVAIAAAGGGHGSDLPDAIFIGGILLFIFGIILSASLFKGKSWARVVSIIILLLLCILAIYLAFELYQSSNNNPANAARAENADNFGVLTLLAILFSFISAGYLIFSKAVRQYFGSNPREYRGQASSTPQS